MTAQPFVQNVRPLSQSVEGQQVGKPPYPAPHLKKKDSEESFFFNLPGDGQEINPEQQRASALSAESTKGVLSTSCTGMSFIKSIE